MNNLDGISVLVTRPVHQAESLCQMIKNAGGKALPCPVIEIVEIPNNSSLHHAAKQLDRFYLAIFISVNAVQYAMPILLDKQKQWPKNVLVATVGKKTLEHLNERWQLSVLCGVEPYNSETLLQRSELQSETVRGRRIVIFRGEGGREFLAESLRLRGAEVSYVNVYRRVQPIPPDWNEQQKPDIAVVTSREGLQNLFAMFDGQPWLRQTPLVVMSERVRAEAQVLGVQATTVVAQAACDEGLFNALIKWRNEYHKITELAG
jgi:uroporphyrinogen-III synthase